MNELERDQARQEEWDNRPNISEPLKALCDTLGLADYERIARVEIVPNEAVAYVYSLNDDGRKFVGVNGGVALERLTVKVRT